MELFHFFESRCLALFTKLLDALLETVGDHKLMAYLLSSGNKPLIELQHDGG